MENEVAVHTGTIQQVNRDKVITRAKFNPVIHQMATHHDQRHRTVTKQFTHTVATCLVPMYYLNDVSHVLNCRKCNGAKTYYGRYATLSNHHD